MRIPIFIVILLCSLFSLAQIMPFSDGNKWGLRDQNNIIVPAKYDTIFGFDPSGRVCLACHRRTTVTSTGFIRVKTTSYACNYLNKSNTPLVVKNSDGDTSSVFSLGRNAVKQYSHTGEAMTVSTGGHRHLVDKNFRQLTFKGYHNVEQMPGTDLYRCQFQSESEAIYTGIISREERPLIPFRYSQITGNNKDSLIIACTAGFKGTDDLYDFKGRKLLSSSRHIEGASRTVLIEKDTDEPRRYFVINRSTGKETAVEADALEFDSEGTVRLRKKKNWYLLDTRTGDQKPLKVQYK